MNNPDATNSRRDGEEPQAPARLVAALKELPARRVFVPPAVDDRVLRLARRHLAGPESTTWDRFRSWRPWAALATACLVLAGFVYFTTKSSPKPEFAREDINRDGRVDILDAFQLARELQSRREPAPGRDLNGDGAVDRRDVDIVAARAVKLEKGDRS